MICFSRPVPLSDISVQSFNEDEVIVDLRERLTLLAEEFAFHGPGDVSAVGSADTHLRLTA